MRDDIEQDFFGAEDSESRAALFEELDAESRRGSFERYLWSGIGAVAVVAVVTAGALMGGSDGEGEGAPPDLPVAEADTVRPSTPGAVAAARAPTPPPTAATITQEPVVPVAPAIEPAPPPVNAAVSDPMEPVPEPVATDPADIDSPWLRKRLVRGKGAPPGTLSDAENALAQGEYEKALSLLQDQADDFTVHSLRGRALLELGQDEAALDALRDALKVKPADGETLVMLGSLLQESDPRQARRHFEAYLRHYPNGTHARDLQGVIARL